MKDKPGTQEKNKKTGWITGWLPTMSGVFPVISTRLTPQDILGGWRVRWGIGRMNYRINPGLYAAGKPDASSPVLVTANYKLTFDSLRKHLEDISAWVLVLDTKGVNVWCSAGKGTFGTEELISRIKSVNLSSLVKHRTVILPQLAAPGVAAHTVTAQTGFKVIYGPVRAADLPKFLANGLKADPGMRTVTFPLKERLAVIPVELVMSWKIALGALVLHFLSRLISGNILSWSTIIEFPALYCRYSYRVCSDPRLTAFYSRTIICPQRLAPGNCGSPYLHLAQWRTCHTVHTARLLILPAISAFLALNFTGCTTYTSLSGVKKEMRIALPLLIVSALSGIVLQLYSAWRIS